jgi:hypothetical protein
MRYSAWNFLGFLGMLALIVGCAYGWIHNIVVLIAADHVTGLVIARVVGIFLVPLGVILGIFT